MKKLIFKLIGLGYSFFCSIIPVNNKRIVIECDYGKGLYGNLFYIYQEIISEKNDCELIIPINKNVHIDIDDNPNVKIVTTRGIIHFYYLLTAKYWITNNHYYYFLKKRKETVLINTWHALGAFKKFALDCNDGKKDEHIKDGNNINYLLVSSMSVAEIYSQALNVPMDNIISIGIPRTDVLFDEEKKKKIKETIDLRINKFNKKVILYAPTFRDEEKEKFNIKLDLKLMKENLDDNFILLVKLHPIIRNAIEIEEDLEDFVFDVSKYDMNELLVYSDILITDYSSVVFEFALLERPIIFFAYDLDEFKNKSREFYFGYEEFIPDNPVTDTNGVINKIVNFENKKDSDKLEKIKSFGEKYCDYKDGKSSKRFVEKFIK